jgi:Putative bacterial sensory transduction regulator
LGPARRARAAGRDARRAGRGARSRARLQHALLRRNRTLRLVRFAHTAAGAVYVQGEVPEAAVTVAEVDRLLGLLVAAAEELREAAGDDGRDG